MFVINYGLKFDHLEHSSLNLKFLMSFLYFNRSNLNLISIRSLIQTLESYTKSSYCKSSCCNQRKRKIMKDYTYIYIYLLCKLYIIVFSNILNKKDKQCANTVF